jgi:hypothetical protein
MKRYEYARGWSALQVDFEERGQAARGGRILTQGEILLNFGVNCGRWANMLLLFLA